ncbi:MAG: hypothetical protein ACI8TS_001837 [Flavobacteriales bacterium]
MTLLFDSFGLNKHREQSEKGRKKRPPAQITLTSKNPLIRRT